MAAAGEVSQSSATRLLNQASAGQVRVADPLLLRADPGVHQVIDGVVPAWGEAVVLMVLAVRLGQDGPAWRWLSQRDGRANDERPRHRRSNQLCQREGSSSYTKVTDWGQSGCGALLASFDGLVGGGEVAKAARPGRGST